ncbi:NACHT N-terminal Helical domain 1-containing protein [Streptomyces xiamenensis]
MIDRAVRAAGPHDPPAPGEHEAVAAALTDTFTALGTLDTDDVQAVGQGLRDLMLYTEFELRVDARVLITVEALASAECRGRTRPTHTERLPHATVDQPPGVSLLAGRPRAFGPLSGKRVAAGGDLRRRAMRPGVPP